MRAHRSFPLATKAASDRKKCALQHATKVQCTHKKLTIHITWTTLFLYGTPIMILQSVESEHGRCLSANGDGHVPQDLLSCDPVDAAPLSAYGWLWLGSSTVDEVSAVFS